MTGINIHFDYSGAFSDTKSQFERSVAIYSWVTYAGSQKLLKAVLPEDSDLSSVSVGAQGCP